MQNKKEIESLISMSFKANILYFRANSIVFLYKYAIVKFNIFWCILYCQLTIPPERISYLSGKRSTYVTIFNQTKSQHFIHRYNSAMDFYSSVSGILVVHISDYSGQLCLCAGLCFLFYAETALVSDISFKVFTYG